MNFSQWLVEHEGTGAKTALYPMGYGGIGLYPPSYMMNQGADALYYMSVDERFLELLDGTPFDIRHIPGKPSHKDTTPGEGPPWSIKKIKETALNEMPINKFELMGNWGPKDRKYGYNKQDIGILTSPKGVQKIHKKWSNSTNDFDLYFLRSAKAYKFIEEGERSAAWVKENLGVDIQPNPNSVTVIFTNNKGTEKIEMTGWMIAHRLGHAIRRTQKWEELITNELYKDLKPIVDNVYGLQHGELPVMKAIAHSIGTMRTAREQNLFSFYEFAYELLAQWITTGKITFNDLPQCLKLDKRQAWGRPNPTMVCSRVPRDELLEYSETLKNQAEKFEYYFDWAIGALNGKMFVM